MLIGGEMALDLQRACRPQKVCQEQQRSTSLSFTLGAEAWMDFCRTRIEPSREP